MLLVFYSHFCCKWFIIMLFVIHCSHSRWVLKGNEFAVSAHAEEETKLWGNTNPYCFNCEEIHIPIASTVRKYISRLLQLWGNTYSDCFNCEEIHIPIVSTVRKYISRLFQLWGNTYPDCFNDNDNDNDNDKQFIFRHVCPYNIKRDTHYVQC